MSRVWKRIKRTYNALPTSLRGPFVIAIMAPREARAVALCLVKGRLQDYFKTWVDYDRTRGMNRWIDLVDWVGGYPFEVAKPELIFDFFRQQGFELTRLATCGGGVGCNQFVFLKPA